MSDLLSEKTPIRARHIRPGQGQAVEMKTGQFLQIQTVQGKQVADFVAFTQGDTEEFLSTSVTRVDERQYRPAARDDALLQPPASRCSRSSRTRSVATTCSMPAATRFATRCWARRRGTPAAARR